MRRATARLMTRSNSEIPQYHLSQTIDLAAALEWIAAHDHGRPSDQRTLPAAVLLRATAVAARRVPQLNGSWLDDDVVPAVAVDLGVAISLRGGGMVTPAICGADRLTVDETMAALRDVVGRARHGSLRSSEVSGASITVTNLGEQGADAVWGVIHPPQLALVGFGRIVDRPVALDGMLGIRPTVIATLTGDHRASDGHVGSRFLAALDHALQHPDQLQNPAPAQEAP